MIFPHFVAYNVKYHKICAEVLFLGLFISSKTMENMQVVNVCDGKILGYINNTEIEICTGKIIAIIVLLKSKFLCFGKNDEIFIPWDKIERVGNDIILVNLGDDIGVYRRKTK